MTLIIPPGFGSAAIELEGAAGTPTHITTIGVDLSEVGGDFVLAANAVFQAYTKAFTARTANTLVITRCTLAVGSDGPGGSVVSSLNPVPGSLSGATEAVAMAPIARKVTNDLGRRGRGRMFLPGMLASSATDQNGRIGSTVLATLQTAVDVFYNNLLSGESTPTPPEIATPGLQPVLLHSSAPSDPTPISSIQVQPIVGWIRGRIR